MYQKTAVIHGQKISDKLPQKLWVSQLTASGFKEGRIYAILNGYRYDNFSPYVFVSEDYGSTWQMIGKELPMEPVNVIKEDPKRENILYIGTDNGMYVSLDRGQNFMTWSGNLPPVPVHDIAIQERDNEIVLGTHGRSAYIAKIDLLHKLTPELLNESLVVFDIEPTQIMTAVGRQRRNAGTGPVVEIPYFIKNDGVVTIQILSQKGAVLATLKDSTQKGLNIYRYNMRMNSSAVTALEKELGRKLNLQMAGNNFYLLPIGTYAVEITLQDGTRKNQKFSLKEISRQPGQESEPGTEEEF